MPLCDRPWWSFLPIGSAIHFLYYDSDCYDSNALEFCATIFHIIVYPTLVIGLSVGYSIRVHDTGSFNLSEQSRLKKQKIIEKQKDKEIYSNTYSHLYKKVFGPSGYADTNLDTAISFPELVSAYRKMGFKDEVMIEGKELPEPSLAQLEVLVKRYEEKSQ